MLMTPEACNVCLLVQATDQISFNQRRTKESLQITATHTCDAPFTTAADGLEDARADVRRLADLGVAG